MRLNNADRIGVCLRCSSGVVRFNVIIPMFAVYVACVDRSHMNSSAVSVGQIEDATATINVLYQP